MAGVLGADDLGQLTFVLSSFKYSNISLSIWFKVLVWFGYIYCGLATIKNAYLVHILTQVPELFSWISLLTFFICLILPCV